MRWWALGWLGLAVLMLPVSCTMVFSQQPEAVFSTLLVFFFAIFMYRRSVRKYHQAEIAARLNGS